MLTAMRHAGCGDPHPIFAGGLRYIPPSAEGQVSREALDELAQFGFTRGDRLTGEFEDVLHTLDRPESEYFAYARDMNEQFGVLVAVAGGVAVTALCSGERVWLKEVPDRQQPPEVLVANLPEYAPASFPTFSLPQDEFRTDGGDGRYERSEDRTRAARMLDDVFNQPYYGLGQFTVAKRPRGGQREVARDELSYLDIDSGRVAMELSGAPGNRYITVLPGEPGLLAQKIASLRASLDN
ncbi:ESX secretion-associated protein EspG [Amycolatopsis sp. NPDC058986]|uniref:ESX secretion-associated protein EspG n=1 Tax=unclassified Amycolatopsis TaxID=2618356 RepID=UPI00366E8FB2